MAYFAIMEREVVRGTDWISKAEFVDVLIPGPNPTQMVMYMGHRKGSVLDCWPRA